MVSKLSTSPIVTREELIDHIMKMKDKDEDYARAALRYYADLLPWLDLNDGVKQAMKDAA